MKYNIIKHLPKYMYIHCTWHFVDSCIFHLWNHLIETHIQWNVDKISQSVIYLSVISLLLWYVVKLEQLLWHSIRMTSMEMTWHSAAFTLHQREPRFGFCRL